MKNKFVYPSEGTKSSGSGNSYVYNEGITKRELFAAMVLQGMSTMPPNIGVTPEGFARRAVLLAEALLTELEKPNK